MDQGVAAFVGAVVGGLATIGGVVVTQRSLARRERKQRELETADRAQIAARILQRELAWAEARINQALKNRMYWSERYELPQAAWEEYREPIALALDSADEWSDVRDGFRALKTAELQASKRRRARLSRSEVTDDGLTQLEFSLARIRQAIAVLQPIARDRPRKSLRQDPERPEAEAAVE